MSESHEHTPTPRDGGPAVDAADLAAARQRYIALVLAVAGGLVLVLVSARWWWDRLTESIAQWLGPPLERLFAPIDAWLASLPLVSGRISATVLFLLAGIWACLLPRRFIYLGAPDQARWRDLRIWAVVALLPYVVIYLFCF